MGVFFIIVFSLADRQTAYYYRVICGFGVSLYISSATEDSCSFLPMRYPRISIRRCVGRSGISSGHSLAVAQHLVTPAGNRRNRLCKRTRANYFISCQAEFNNGFFVSELRLHTSSLAEDARENLYGVMTARRNPRHR